MDIRRENRLRIFIDRDSRIRPPQKRLRQRGTIIQLAGNFNIRFSRIQRNFGNLTRSVHLIHIMGYDGLASILIFKNRAVDRKIRRRPVMLRPVKLDSSGNPRTKQTDQRRFDYMIVIDKIIPIRFVVSSLDSSSKFRQNHYLQIFVFQINGPVGFLHLIVPDPVYCRIRVHFAAASLIDTFFKKNRIFSGFPTS